jgi:hypothetical protein
MVTENMNMEEKNNNHYGAELGWELGVDYP